MARNQGTLIENNLTGGLVSDANGLTFPANAVVSTNNCVFSENGPVTRRFGFDYETNYEFNSILKAGVIKPYIWNSAGNNGQNTILVFQVGATLHFFIRKEDVTASLSGSRLVGTINLDLYRPPGSPDPSLRECYFSSGRGYLFVAHPTLNQFYVSYDYDTDAVTGTIIELKIRDFEGVTTPENAPIDQRYLTDISNEYRYNLYNQGWFPIKNYFNGSNLDTGQFSEVFRSQIGFYPNDTDVWWYLRGTTSNTSLVGEFFWPDNYYDTVENGNTPAPKGHYIINPYYQDRSAVSDIPGINVKTTEYQRVSKTVFFAGRVWYAGLNSKGFSQKLYFSQIIEREDQFGQCFQRNDPTSELNFDLLPTDGGEISITDAGTILHLTVIDTSLIIFASNGIWAISGSQGIGFTTTDFSIRKLSSLDILDTTSFVDVAGYPAWWNSDAIYILTSGEISGSFTVKSLTDNKLKQYIDKIPLESKKWAKGVFNPYTKVVQWCFSSSAPSNQTQRYEFDRILNFNVVSTAFYPWTIEDHENTICGLFLYAGPTTLSYSENVTVNGVNVTASTINVTSDIEFITEANPTFKYITYNNNQVTFSETNNDGLIDWPQSSNPLIYTSDFITGYRVHDQGNKDFQSNYVTVYSKTLDEPSVFYFNGYWDFTNNVNTGRVSTQQYVNMNDEDYDYSFRRLKIRGQGHSLQFRVQSIESNSFNITGWSIWETGNTQV